MMNPLSNKITNNKIQDETLKSEDVSNDILVAVKRLMELNDDNNINNDARRGRGRKSHVKMLMEDQINKKINEILRPKKMKKYGLLQRYLWGDNAH
ncbi:hypothetical protein L195_g021380 [Trifolium pratense]|uniref:Uncharacterized protein n=1 Tax=Trifolium pratense TaxID=57577 RepID=A0A2K3N519_TRIPR|nr:hypothetical protein L195_g021380 [Trifolium pratense]